MFWDVLALFQGHRVGLPAVALQRLLAGVDLLALLGQPLPEPVGGFLRRHELELEVLFDVPLGQQVDHVRGERGIGRLELDVHEAAVCVRGRGSFPKGSRGCRC